MSSVIERKLDYFKECVERVCEKSKLKKPFVTCFCLFENELAHCHTTDNQICIDLGRLANLDPMQIQDTALHEVAHFLKEEHGPSHIDTQLDLRWNVLTGGIRNEAKAMS